MELLLSHQTQFVHLYSQIHRNTDTTLFMKSLQTLIVSLRKAIMTSQQSSVQKLHFTILKLLFKLIVYSRDIHGGLGEREISNCMLFIWKYHFPVPTAFCLHNMVMSSSGEPPFGSWRDIKGFCNFIRKHSEKGEEDPFIETCIGFMNHQLDSDLHSWNDAYKNDAYKNETVKVGVSLVSRWIPRESSANKWLFERCSIQWIRAYRPHYLESIGNSHIRFQKAFNKGKKEYRQICSFLSKLSDTLQIKQCSNQWDKIEPEHIPMKAMSMQQNSLLNIGANGKIRHHTANSITRQACAITIQSWWLTHKTKLPVYIEMGTIIKQAISVSHPYQIYRMECLWTSILDQIPDMPYMIPVLDMSLFHTDIESFYNALGMALAISCKSTIFGNQKRLLAFDKTAHFVSLTGNLSQMMDIMKPIFHEHHIGSDLENALSMCLDATSESNLDEILKSNLVFVIFSRNRALQSTPASLYWGQGEDKDDKFPRFVGCTNHTLTRIAQLPSDTWKHLTPFLFIQYLLSNKRYDSIDTYFDTILKT